MLKSPWLWRLRFRQLLAAPMLSISSFDKRLGLRLVSGNQEIDWHAG
jgi:hypothetical protein